MYKIKSIFYINIDLVIKIFDCSPDFQFFLFSQHTGDLFTSVKYLGLIFSKNILIFLFIRI